MIRKSKLSFKYESIYCSLNFNDDNILYTKSKELTSVLLIAIIVNKILPNEGKPFSAMESKIGISSSV